MAEHRVIEIVAESPSVAMREAFQFHNAKKIFRVEFIDKTEDDLRTYRITYEEARDGNSYA